MEQHLQSQDRLLTIFASVLIGILLQILTNQGNRPSLLHLPLSLDLLMGLQDLIGFLHIFTIDFCLVNDIHDMDEDSFLGQVQWGLVFLIQFVKISSILQDQNDDGEIVFMESMMDCRVMGRLFNIQIGISSML